MGMTAHERQVVVDLVSTAIAEAIAGFEAEVAGLRKQVAELQKRPAPARGLGGQDGAKFAEAVVAGVREYVARNLAPIVNRVKELEARPAMTYEGVWRTGRPYARGAVVTHAGSVWYCLEATTSKPPGSAWQLAAKSHS